jgi:hypothetical protein
MDTDTFEIYQSLRTFGSRKRVYLTRIQFKTIGDFVKRNLDPHPPNLATMTKWKAMCNMQA